MNPAELLARCADEGVHLWAQDGQLRFRAPQGRLTDELRAALRTHKEAILHHLDADRAVLLSDEAGRHEPFPLTDIQAAYLIGRTDAYAYGGTGCHAYVELEYSELDVERVATVWRELVQRHDMLRAVIHGDGYQQVLPGVPALDVTVDDLAPLGDGSDADAALARTRARMSVRHEPTDRRPLFDVHVSLTPTRAVLHLSFDMLTVDHASLRILLAEFQTRYGGTALSEAPRISFRDYVLARRALTDGAEYSRDRAYWTERLDTLPPAPELPLAEAWEPGARATGAGREGTAGDTVRFSRLEYLLPSAARQRLTERAARRGLTVSTALLTAYAETVGRWSRTTRFTLNVPTVDRPPLHEDIARLVGDFTSLELLAVDLDAPASFGDRVRTLGAQLLEDLTHPLFTGSEVLAELSRRAGAPVLMPVVFTSALGSGSTSDGVPPEVTYAATQTPQVWLDCQVMRRGEALSLSWDIREGALSGSVPEDMFAAYTGLVRLLAGEGAASEAAWDGPARIELPAAQAARRAEVNATEGSLPDALLHEPVLARATVTPDAIAVRTPELALSYRQLVARANGLAGALEESGLRPGEPVAIWMDKGWEQAVAVLGVLVAGGAYLPVDTAQPPARRDTILADAAVRTVLTQSWLAETDDLPANVSSLAVDLLPEDGPAPRAHAPRHPDELAYVIYTSGSTGTPKGVMISHRAALNTVEDINRRFAVTARDRVLGIAGLSFDLSVYDLFGPLSVGATLVLPQAERRGDPSHWAELVQDFGVTVWNSVPGQLHMLCDWLRAEPPADDDSTVRLALVSGDWVPVALPDEARAVLPGLEVISLGGATEGSIWSIAHPIGEVDTTRPSIPYGKPLTNQRFAVLDKELRPRPEWVPGELYIAGAGVAMGYLGDETRTAERFLDHPVSGERVYRTGDLGRYLPDGTIEFLGREDAQVKIRGYRVELAEVEAAVQAHPAVAAGAVVVDDSASGGRRLAAFVETARRDGDEPARPGTAGVHKAAAVAVREASEAVDPARLRAFLDALDEVALGEMTRVLTAAGLFGDGGAHTADEVGTALRSTPRHRHIVRRWLRALAGRGRLTHHAADDTYGGLAPVAGPEREQRWRRAADLEHEVGWSSELLTVMRTCADRLPGLIAGDTGIRELLFPGAALDAADAAYRDNLAIRHLNRAVVAALREIAAAHTGEDRLRVLEVGGGVGGTTGELVPVLAEYGVDYLFTDASAFFLNEARERFADHAWVRYQRYDVDEDPRTHGLVPNTFDVVVCANTLHAAADADAAVGRLRELLVPGGQLVFVENTRDENCPLLVSMEFLEVAGHTWTDVRAHTGQSFLTHPQWRELLGRHEATDVVSLPEPEDPLAVTGQEVFIATMKGDRHHVPTGELARSAATRLPDYMLPTVWQVVDALPRTANGKTDRSLLRSWLPRENALPVVDERPMDDLENSLAGLWAELLSAERVTRNDDFFALGGDSLLVARMVAQLRDRVPQAAELEWEAVLRHMLRRPTVAGLAGFLRGLTGEAETPGIGALIRTDPVIHLHGARSADEPTTVLVHAGTATIMPYRALITEIRRRSPGLAEVVGVEVPDLNGFLASPPEGLIEQLAADYARALMAGGRRRFHVVGYCLGGLIATEVARNLAESGAEVESLTVISSHSPRFRLDDELLSEYSFAVMMGIDPAALGFPGDQYRVAAAADAVLAGSPGVLPDGGLAALPAEFADVAQCFQAMAEVPRATRIARMCEAVPASAGTYGPEHMTRLFLAFRQSVFAITRYDAEPYAGDITFLRHDGAYPFPGSKDAVTAYWHELALGDLDIVDIGGDHYSCLSVEHAPSILKTLSELTQGAITR